MGANQYGKFGFPSMVNRSSKKHSSKRSSNNSEYSIVRVISVITSTINEDGNSSVGIITGEEITSDGLPTKRIIKGIYPSDPYRTILPVVNEFVPIWYVVAPNRPKGRWVYGAPIALYGITAQNVNSSPSPFTNPLPPSQNIDYSQAFIGATNIIPDNGFELDYNSPNQLENTTFIERGNIHPLLPFEGDIIYEGRWGNSIRFGSTVKTKNPWSTSGDNGDPILILRNGQNPNSSNFGAEPIIEDIKKDLSSIYLTSTQQLKNFSLANENFISYTTPPKTPASYNNPQIVLNSNRIILNANSDSILISGEKSVGISSNNSINIESTSEIDITSKLVKLGSINANQAVLRGDETIAYLKALIIEIENIASALKTVQNWPGGIAAPNPVLLNVATCALETLETVYNEIDSVKSKTVKTI